MLESPLDQLLNGKSQAFKDKVRSLVQRYGINENDPTFILLIGTSTLEALLDKYPQEFKTLFGQLLSQMDKRWGELQQGWAIAAGQSTAVATQLTQSINWLKQASSAEQVKAINKGVRIKHYVEAAAIACACATALILTSWTTGWVSRGRAEDNTAWADIERWNKNELQACVKAEKDTCNFHIEMPEKKKQ